MRSGDNTRWDRWRLESEHRGNWGVEVQLHRNHPDTYPRCLMEVTCGRREDLEGWPESCGKDSWGIVGLEGICHSGHNNSGAVGGLELVWIRMMKIRWT